VLTTPPLHSKGPSFKAWFGDLLTAFVVLLNSVTQILGNCLKVGHSRFLPHLSTSLFTIIPPYDAT